MSFDFVLSLDLCSIVDIYSITFSKLDFLLTTKDISVVSRSRIFSQWSFL